MSKSIVIVGSLDTKGEEIKYCADYIEGRGHKAIVMDVGIVGDSPFEPTISKLKVMEAAGESMENILALKSESKAIAKMAEGASIIVKELYESDRLDGVLALGGTMGTSLALTMMKVLPLGVPKLILSTIAFSRLVPTDITGGDLMMMKWGAGFRGINSINIKVLEAAAGAITGAAEAFYKKRDTKLKPTVAITSMGGRKYVNMLRPALEQRGYEQAVFHACGGGGALEQAIDEGLIDVVLDLALYEIANEVAGGMISGGKHRLEKAGERGIPQIVAPIVDAVHLAGHLPVPRKFRNRPMHVHNWLVTAVATTKEEKVKAGRLIAEKLNKAKGPTAVIIPVVPDKRTQLPGLNRLWDLEGMKALSKVLKSNLKPNIKVIEVESGINEPLFIEKLLELFDEITQRTHGEGSKQSS
jgi:uncharacterized protein (UPF0261 family)